MRIPGLKTAWRSAQWLGSRFMRGVLILGYHRISESDDDPYRLCVTPEHFNEHLSIICRIANPISLTDAVQGLAERNLPDRAVVVTFDDGYADALSRAKPALERYDVPATFFVVTGNLGRAFWWDELSAILIHARDVDTTSTIEFREKVSNWGMAKTDGPTKAGQDLALLSAYRYLLRLPSAERQHLLDPYRELLSIDYLTDPECRSLTKAELVQLGIGDLLEIGSHSVSHPRFSDLAPAEQKMEINESMRFLTDLLGKEVLHFSFPNGARSPGLEPMLRNAGIHSACTSRPGVALRRSLPFQLPRFRIGDWSGAHFESWLKRWLTLRA